MGSRLSTAVRSTLTVRALAGTGSVSALK